jgi:ketosteroid isomerase-like protein
MTSELEATVQRLERRVRELEDERAILDTLYAYAHALDYGDRDEWIDCWTEDAELTWPHTTFHGVAEITQAYDDHSHAPQSFHKHVLVEPRVRIDGDRATVASYFARVNNSHHGPVTRSFGRYLDVLARESDGRWRIRQRVAERESIIPDAPLT